ncbi:hypothetical protein HMPREF1624_07130 [Sporothrix schenckii ATCC 58251]|uniref:Carrier domain-containing protein n=1 Tax=Sporothrix schenckii (strain ATCC 58251 / de Perez 2211183) TaxID=1391915 RepID=U7PMQ1_SPOS1|nr:hypothetical protein HMPREF1624_07130 [Sporothrix schenckii ATCC 58251]
MVDKKPLSILNPEPRKLPGPALLHLLVSGAEDGDRTDAAAASGHNVARAQAEAVPQPLALDYRAPDGTHVTLSYPELHKIALFLAVEISRRLDAVADVSTKSSLPTTNDFVVPVLIPQAPELYVSLLAILKSGGAFCPIQLDAPPDRIRFILDDVGAGLILTTSAMAARLPEGIKASLQVMLVDELHLFDRRYVGPETSETPTSSARTVGPDDLAYVMYTSGSTGTPKGVGVPHGAATQSLLSHDHYVPSFQRFLQFAAPTFDVSVFEIFFPWFRGATLVCCSRADLLDDLPAVITSLDVDACELTPTVAGSLLQSRANAPGLKLLLTIGEMLTEPVICEFGAGPEQTSILWAMYGPTEAAIHCTLQPALDGTASVKNIGFPLETVSAYILAIPDEEGDESDKDACGDPRLAQMGEAGELAVGGHQLARGYINRPEQTAAAFIDTQQYGRLYRTGDKARVTEQGTLECSGRLSGGQVKLRGQRIELGEVEQAVLRTDGCRGSVAAVINGILVAFCDAGPKAFTATAFTGLEEAILDSCRSWLPRFMVPGDIVLMPDFPRLPSGKVDRKRLSSEYTELNTEQVTEPPPEEFEDDLDYTLHQVARSVLDSTIRNTVPLASVGLDSLKAIRFAATIRGAGFPHVSAVDVLESRTLAALHSRIRQSTPEASDNIEAQNQDYLIEASDLFADNELVRSHFKLDDVERVVECTPIQIAMLAETLADPRAYCNWVELGFRDNTSCETIFKALDHQISQHEALRTGFAQYHGRFVQVIRRYGAEDQIRTMDQLQRDCQLDTEEKLLMPFYVDIEEADINKVGDIRVVLHMHHAMYDGWSLDLLRRNLHAFLRGEFILSANHYSAVVQHSRCMTSAQREAAEHFWAETLNGFQPSALPELNARRDVTGRILSREILLSSVDGTPVDKAHIDRVANAVGCSTQTLFQAALAWLWSGLVGSPDVVLGTVTSGRTLPVDNIMDIVGPCLQTVPLRADFSRMHTIRDLLLNIHASNRALLAHAFLPLPEIKKIAGTRPGQFLYDVLFVYQESMYSNGTEDDLVREIGHKDYLETKMLWEVEPQAKHGQRNGTFRIRTTFHADSFPEVQVEMLLKQYAAALEHIVANVNDTLSAVYAGIPVALQSRHNLDYRTFDGHPDLAQLVQKSSKRFPTRPAVCFATSFNDGENNGEGLMQYTTITFDELNRMANQIARCLRKSLGAKPGDAVAIVMEKSVLLYAGILGILKAGCAYLPLLPTTPLTRIHTILEQAGVRCILSDTRTTNDLSSLNICPVLDLQIADLRLYPDEDLEGDEAIPADPARIANIVYTSGSTGVPKGVCVTQLNICSNLDVLSRIYPISQKNGGRLLQSCSQAFDVSVFEIFFSWVYGLCLCSATNDVLFEDLERTIRLFGITHLSMTPTVAALVNPQNTPSVEFLVTAGEPLTEKVANMWSKQLFQGYGPSETTNICTVKKMALGDTIRHLGFAFENTSTVVLRMGDASGQTVPFGAVGEFCFGGDQVVAGYLGLPSLTAEKFIQHPVYGRLYRSGDIGRMLPDGSLMITGRVDDQIKLRGQRIELNEINAVLCASPLVAKAVTVVARKEDSPESSSDQLVAFYMPSLTSSNRIFCVFDSHQDLAASLFLELQSRLPVYMVPTFLIPITNMPLTPAGKVNKALLLNTFRSLSQDQLSAFTNNFTTAEDDDAAQWTDIEVQISVIIADVFRSDAQSIRRWTPLASVGLDSLSAIHVSRRLNQTFPECRLAISDILRNMSIAQLAQLIAEKSATTSFTSGIASTVSLDVFSSDFLSNLQSNLEERRLSSTKPATPCLPLQEAMLVSPTRGKTYVNRMLFRLVENVDVIQEAWMEVCARQDILRTCFVTSDHVLYPIAQVVLDTYTAPWLDLATSATDTLDTLVEQHAQSLPYPVDSFQPPVSFAAIRDRDTQYLSFVCHHAVYDGEAMGRLLWEVEQVVLSMSGQEKSSVILNTAPNFSMFLQQALNLPSSTDQFWSDHLAGYKPTLLLANRPAAPDKGSGILEQALDMPLSAIQDQVKRLGYSLLTACQAAWTGTMAILMQTDDVCFGNVYNGRSVPVENVDSLVAPCFNTLPVRANISVLQSNRDLLSYFQTLNPDLLLHQFTPLRQIQRQHGNGRRLFDSLLLLQQPSRPLNNDIWTLERDDGEMDLPMVFELTPAYDEDKLRGRLHFDKNIVTPEAASVVVDLFGTVMTTLVQFSSSRIPSRTELPQSLQDKLDNLHLNVESFGKEAEDSGSDAVLVHETDEIWTTTESVIRTVLSRLAAVPADNIRRDTTIYRLGLDSVRAVQVASELRKQGLQVSAVDVMEHPSAATLAAATLAASLSPPLSPPLVQVTGATTTSNNSEFRTPDTSSATHTLPSSSLSVASPGPLELQTIDFNTFRAASRPVLDKHGFYLEHEIETVLPCTPLQTGLLTEFVRSKGKHYFNFITFEQKRGDEIPRLDGAMWQKAWRQVACSTPMLRTGFVSMDGAADSDSDSNSDDAFDALSPFAMVQISLESMEHHARVLLVNDGHDFDLKKWKREATVETLTNLQLPPWQVAIVDGRVGDIVTCHLAIHHALYDAASLRVLLDDVTAFIQAGHDVKRKETPSTELVVSDILHQVASLTGSSSPVADLWREKSGQTVVNTFPLLTPLNESQGYAVLSRPSSRLLDELQTAVRSAGFTMHAVLQAAWTRILSSYVGDASVVFGAVLSGRSSEATERADFPCISTLPVVAQNKSSNRALVEQLMHANILLHKSQHVPLRQIQRWLGQPDTRLFDTLLVYQTAERGSSSDNCPWTISDEEAIVDYPISIEAIAEASDRPLLYQITFDNSVLPREHATILLNQLDAIVNHLATHPDGDEDDFVELNPELYSVLPPTVRELQSDVKLLHEFVERQAELRPTKVALQFVTAFDESRGGVPVSKEWSFDDLNTRGNQVASLVSQHAEPGSIVAICFDKCPEAFVAMLGILKAGCAYLALDPGAPSSRKEFILQDAGAPLLLTDVTRAAATVSDGGLSDITPAVTILDIDMASLDTASDCVALSSVRRAPEPSDVCYCLYTSGTTGTPKGCAITHENAVQCMLAFQELFRNHYDAETSRWLQFASFHFDVAVLEQYWTWSVGMTLVGAPRDLILEDLAGTISRLDITHIDLTPSLGRLLDPNDVPSLCRGVFITGGEPLKQEMLDPWGPTGAVHNFYGPTEATIGVTSYPQVPRNGRASNIGRQFPNVGTLVFRPGTQTPILRGGVGELCVSGTLVGQGYLNRAELTNERFPILDGDGTRYRQDHGDRIYRTGDLVRMMHDGCFDFLGRADDQIKLRGQRLEIGEINHAIRLGLGASVGDVATQVIRDEDNKKDFLVSFVVVDHADGHSSASDSAILSRQVQVACRERLPGYMVPTYVVPLAAIPLSANNKADGKELKRFFNSLSPDERMHTTGAATSDVAAPTTASTAALPAPLSEHPSGKIVVQVLHKLGLLDPNHHTLAQHTSIFELGIDSVSVLRFSRALRRAGVSSATPSAILAHPNMGDLIAALHDAQTKQSTTIGSVLEAQLLVDACQHRKRAQVAQSLGVASDQIEYIAPCSALQQGILSRARSGPEHRDTYFNTFHFELDSTVSVERLQKAWATVTARNSILRTRFVATRDGIVQAALKPDAVTLPWMQLNLGDNADVALALQEKYIDWVDSCRGNDITNPIQHLSFAYRGANTHVLHIFHGLYDATSLGLVLSQVATAYKAEPNRLPSSSAPTFLHALVHGPLRNHSRSRPFWERHLKDRGHFQPLQPLVVSKCATREDIGVECTLSFADVEHMRVRLGVTHAALVQALWLSVLYKNICSRASNGVALGLVLSGRTMDDLDGAEGVVGPLFNTLPFFAPVAELESSFAALAQACHAYNVATLPFQHTPLRDIQKWCSAGQPLFDILFSFQFGDESFAGTSSATSDLWTQSEPAVHADYPLALEAVLMSTPSSPTLRLVLVAMSGIADKTVLNHVLDEFESALEAVAKDPFSSVIGTNNGIVHVMDNITPNPTPEPVTSDAFTANLSKETTSAPFVWRDTAATLRRTIASLAGVQADTINENTTLLELGLDSVDTIKLSARLRTAGVRLTNSQLVRGQSILTFLGMIEVANNEERAPNGDVSASKSSGDTTIASTSEALRSYFNSNGRDLSNVSHLLPPTPLQEAMVADMIQSNFALYFNNDILEITPGVDIARLKAAWAFVVAKQAILRTVFFNIDSPDFAIAYSQAVKKSIEFIEECSVVSTAELVAVADKVRRQAIHGEGESGLFQLTFVHTSDTRRWYLVLSIAHALYDGRSLDRLHRTVEATYHHSDNAAPVSPAEDPAYIGQLGLILQSSAAQADAFWLGFLEGAQPTYVPRQNTMSVFDVQAPEKTVVRLESTSSVSVADLQAFGRQQATSVQVIGQACWAAVLASLTGSLDLLFGVVLSGRAADEDDATVFPTMNTVPVRVVLHGTPSELLQYMQSNMGSIGEHQYYPLRKAQRAVKREAGSDSSSASGIFNTLFVLQKRGNKELQDTEKPVIMKSIGGASDVEYPICVEMELVHDDSGKDTVVWRTACDTAYVSRHGAVRLLHQLDVALRFMVHSSAASSTTSILAFDDNGVSICSLPPFKPKVSRQAEEKLNMDPPTAEASQKDSGEWTEAEMAIREVLSAVSGTPESAIQRTGQTLYHLGLDSISTIKVSSLLKKTKGIVLGVRALLAAGSIQEMAAMATAGKEDMQNTSFVSQTLATSILLTAHIEQNLRAGGMSPADVETVLPATPMQVHMISVWQNTGGDVFFPAFCYRLQANETSTIISLYHIHSAWAELVAELPILRSIFMTAAVDAPVPLLQAVIRNKMHKIPPSLDESKVVHSWPTLGDTSAQPLFAILSVAREVDAGHVSFLLTLRIHHALYDAVSLETMLGRFQELLVSPLKGKAKATSTAWEQSLSRQLSTATTESNKAYWSKYFAGANLRSSVDIPGKVQKRGRASFYRRSAFDNVAPLKDMAAKLGVGLQSLVFAVYAKMLSTENASQDDVVFGVYLANRINSGDDDKLAAYPTLCLVPLLVRSPSTRSVADMAAQIQADLHALAAPPSPTAAAPLTASLWEIQQWTGVAVESFVNFLLPDDLGTVGASSGISLELVEMPDKASPPPSPSAYPSLHGNRVREAYKDAIDVEMAVRNDTLDIGAFGSASRLGDDGGAEKTVQAIVSALLAELSDRE